MEVLDELLKIDMCNTDINLCTVSFTSVCLLAL